jgi:hypothetical protein
VSRWLALILRDSENCLLDDHQAFPDQSQRDCVNLRGWQVRLGPFGSPAVATHGRSSSDGASLGLRPYPLPTCNPESFRGNILGKFETKLRSDPQQSRNKAATKGATAELVDSGKLIVDCGFPPVKPSCPQLASMFNVQCSMFDVSCSWPRMVCPSPLQSRNTRHTSAKWERNRGLTRNKPVTKG